MYKALPLDVPLAMARISASVISPRLTGEASTVWDSGSSVLDVTKATVASLFVASALSAYPGRQDREPKATVRKTIVSKGQLHNPC